MDKRQSAPMKADEASSSSDSQELKSSNVIDSNGVGGDAAPISNVGSKFSGSGGGIFSRVNTTPPKILSSDISEPVPSEFNLERSRTERQRHNVVLAKDAAQIFDEKITDHQKLKLLKRITTVKHDGTVEFEVSGDVGPQTVGIGHDNVHSELDEEPLDTTELQHIPPLQIDYGHRVRLATHSNFKEFVLTSGLEFFPLGGDPKVLAEYWGNKVDVVGFCFLDLATNYEPPESLTNWLKAGPKPIYIGFGSLPIQDPEKMTQIIVQALEITKQRGVINKGWGGLGNLEEPKDFVYLLVNCPHDWLFLQCTAGGASWWNWNNSRWS